MIAKPQLQSGTIPAGECSKCVRQNSWLGKDVKPAPKGAKGELAGEDYAAIKRILQEDE